MISKLYIFSHFASGVSLGLRFTAVCLRLFIAVFLSLCAVSDVIAQDPFLRREESEDGLSSETANLDPTEEAGANSGEDVSPVDDKEDGNRKTKAKNFPGYGAYRESLVEYCKQLIADGQQSRIQKILDELLIQRSDCRPCRQLYKALSCKVPSKQASTAKVPKSNPSTEILAVLSDVFVKISKNTDLAVPTAEALTPLLNELSKKSDRISDAYYEIYIAFIKAAMSKQLEGALKAEEKQQNKIKNKQLDALF